MTLLIRFIFILLIFAAVPLTVCSMDEEETRRYDLGYKATYQSAFDEGSNLGETAGQKSGNADAEKYALEGTAWQLYYYLTLASLLSGTSLGLIVQYGILWRCRRTRILPQFSTVAFVPAMNSSIAYSIFLRKREVMLELDEQLREMAARENLQVAKIQQLEKTIRMKVEAISSIEELTQTRMLELAKEEMNKIINVAEEKQRIERESSSPDEEEDILDLWS